MKRDEATSSRQADPQAYYFTEEWQRDEAETLRALKRGEGRTFRTGRDAVDWLRGDPPRE